jgi:hypothetical protein
METVWRWDGDGVEQALTYTVSIRVAVAAGASMRSLEVRCARFGPGLWSGPRCQAREPGTRHVTLLTGVTITSPSMNAGVPSCPHGSSMGFLSRLFIPRGVRCTVHPGRALKRRSLPRWSRKPTGLCTLDRPEFLGGCDLWESWDS